VDLLDPREVMDPRESVVSEVKLEALVHLAALERRENVDHPVHWVHPDQRETQEIPVDQVCKVKLESRVWWESTVPQVQRENKVQLVQLDPSVHQVHLAHLAPQQS